MNNRLFRNSLSDWNASWYYAVCCCILVILNLSAGSSPAHAQASCAVGGDSLESAKQLYAASCDAPRIDCDPSGDSWTCASYQIGDYAPVAVAVVQPASATTVLAASGIPAAASTAEGYSTPTATITLAATNSPPSHCEYLAESLGAARSGYAQNCAQPRIDCDQVDGNWVCASYRMGTHAGSGNNAAGSVTGQATITGPTTDASPTTDTSPNASTPATSPNNGSGSSTGIAYQGAFGPPQRGWADSYSVNGKCYIATTFDHGIGGVQVDTPAGKKTVREIATAIGPGPGIGSNPIYNDVQCGNGPANNAGDEAISECPGRVDMGAAGCPLRGPTWDLSVFQAAEQETTAPPAASAQTNINQTPVSDALLPADSRFSRGDLISLHYDNGGDRDDGHAAAAGLMVVDKYGLRNSVHVVNGTYEAIFPERYQTASEALMFVIWGAEGARDTWWNADARPTVTRNATADRWRSTLQAGGQVWVAEGGPSDFTAAVLRQLAEDASLDLKRVHVVQHSHGYNEDHTGSANLADMQRLATYHRIDNGNRGGNGTPNLNQQLDGVARRLQADAVYGPVWNAAFNYLPAIDCQPRTEQCKFDGSDAVEILWIVGIESDEVRDWTDFANRYAN